MEDTQNTTPPVAISIIGTGDGGVHPTPDKTIAVTPDHQPNLLVQVVTPIVAITVRAINLFLVAFSAALTVAGIGGDKILPVADMEHAITLGLWMGLSAAGVGTVKNLITVFGRLEGKYPLGTGSI